METFKVSMFILILSCLVLRGFSKPLDLQGGINDKSSAKRFSWDFLTGKCTLALIPKNVVTRCDYRLSALCEQLGLGKDHDKIKTSTCCLKFFTLY